VPLGAFVERRAAQGNALVNGAAIANFSRFTHHHAHRMVKENLFANNGTGMNFNTGKKTRDVRNETPQPLEVMTPAPMCPPVQHQRMQTGVAGENFPAAACSRVALKNALNVGT
jgi:hypothetical protein